MLKEGQVATEPSSIIQKTQQPRNQAAKIGKTINRGEGIENGVFIENDITCIRGSKPADKKKNNKQKQAKLHEGDQTLEEGVGGEEGERASVEVFGSPEQLVEKDSSSSSLGISKLRSKPG